ncbi:MAG: F0F1 ATP synthase subunit alpha, partial [Novosphingopyxis baekryungensis]|nr:F0F1 ATP synthase subunit alpha [Novosphingopyxis baekryungensis]
MSEAGSQVWLETARASVEKLALGARAEEIGRVEEVGDGVALISGMRQVRLDELLRFEHGQFGFAQMLDADRIGCVLLDDVGGVQAG